MVVETGRRKKAYKKLGGDMKKVKTRINRLRELIKNEAAVSPVIGVILMIAITVVIAAVVASFAYGIIGGVAKAPNSALVIEDARVSAGTTNITVIHHGGDTIVDAFTVSGTAPDITLTTWDNLIVKLGGVDIPEGDVRVGGNNDTNFVSGEEANHHPCKA